LTDLFLQLIYIDPTFWKAGARKLYAVTQASYDSEVIVKKSKNETIGNLFIYYWSDVYVNAEGFATSQLTDSPSKRQIQDSDRPGKTDFCSVQNIPNFSEKGLRKFVHLKYSDNPVSW